jgi:hypothetical protein
MLVALSALALAQSRPSDASCKATETQAECHARLKCRASEELEDCQKRLLRCKANEDLEVCKQRVGSEPAKDGTAGQRDGADHRGGDRDAAERNRDRDADRESRDRDQPDRERGDRDSREDDASQRRQRGQRHGDDRQQRRRAGGTKGFEANKTFGLGIELGEPSGLNGKYFVSDSGALDFGIGWIYSHYYYGDGIHLYGDYLWHPTSLVSSSAFELPFYVGVGLRYWQFDFCDRGLCNYRGSAVGVRVPVGISFDFNNVPLDIFLQLVPVLDFVNGDYYDRYNDRAHFGIDLSVGLRYWFK